MKYAVIQYGYAILSIGETKERAIDNFLRDAGPFEEEPHIYERTTSAYYGRLMALPITDEMCQRVEEQGGDIHFDISDSDIVVECPCCTEEN